MATRRALTILLATACVAAASVEEPGKVEDSSDAEISAEEIFANPLDDDAYVRSSRCLSTGKYRRVEIMNNQILIFHGRGENIWLNVLPNRCLGLQPDMILRIEKRGMRLCARDQFRGVPRFQGEADSMPCTLGDFNPMRPENVAAMRDALDANQRTSTVSKTVRSAEGDAEAPAESDS